MRKIALLSFIILGIYWTQTECKAVTTKPIEHKPFTACTAAYAGLGGAGTVLIQQY
jgi:hypothetical protein